MRMGAALLPGISGHDVFWSDFDMIYDLSVLGT